MNTESLIHRLVIEKLLSYKDGTYIEAGANDGINGSNTLYLEQQLNWSGILIEPSVNVYNQCMQNRDLNKNIIINAALVSRNDIKTVSGDFDGNLMASIDGKRLDRVGTDTIRAITLGKIIDKLDVKMPIDFLSLDVEGYELEALKGLDLNRHIFKYMLIEVNTKFYSLEDIISLLEPHGYQLYDNITKFNLNDNPGWSGDHNDYLFKKNI